MARLPKRPPFDKDCNFVAAKAFTCNGRHYKIADSFVWRRAGISQRRALLLYDNRMIKAAPEYEDLEDFDYISGIKDDIKDLLFVLEGVDYIDELVDKETIQELLDETDDLDQLDDIRKHLEGLIDKA